MSRVKCIFITKYCHYTFARSQRPTEYFQSVGGKRPFEMGQKGKHALVPEVAPVATTEYPNLEPGLYDAEVLSAAISLDKRYHRWCAP